MTVDEWAAEMCGVKVTRFDPENDQLEQYWEYKGKTYDGKWTIKDPRCREIVRDKLDLITGKDGSRRTCYQDKRFSDTLSFGEDIEAAEIACIAAIYEAEE